MKLKQKENLLDRYDYLEQKEKSGEAGIDEHLELIEIASKLGLFVSC